MRTGVCRNAIGAAAVMFASGSVVAEDDPGVIATYAYPIAAVQKAAVDALDDIGCKISKVSIGYVEGARPHKTGWTTSSGGERVVVTLTAVSKDSTSVDIQTRKTFVGYVQQTNWDEAVRDGIRQRILKPAPSKDEGALVSLNQPSPLPDSKPRKEAQAQSSASNKPAVDGAAIVRGLAVFAVVAADVFVASKGYAPAPVVLAVPSPAHTVSQSPVMCPDGSYVSRPPCTLCPNGHYVGGSSVCTMAPNGTFVPANGPPRMAPDGTFHGAGSMAMCPNGSYVTGTVCILAPNGSYVGK